MYGIDKKMLYGNGDTPWLELADEKLRAGTTTVSFAEKFRGLPVWQAGVSTTLLSNPLRVVSSQSTVHRRIELAEPDETEHAITPENATPQRVATLLGEEDERDTNGTGRKRTRRDEPRHENETPLRINSTRALIYRFDPEQRYDPETAIRSEAPLSSGPPTLRLPALSDAIEPGKHYVVTEVLFTLPIPELGDVHWRGFFERRTGSVLYLRAFIACANALVYIADPITTANGPLPTGTLAQLDALRSLVDLSDIKPQIGGSPVALTGTYVNAIHSVPPQTTENTGHFLYHVNTAEFSGTNAYYHLDELFRLMESLGISVFSFFDDSAFSPGFPLPATYGFPWVNAYGLGNVSGNGSGGFLFGSAAAGTNVGIGDDARVVAHEFCHALLWDSVSSPNFGFSHSAGDSIAVILGDPASQAPDRFVSFPWVNVVARRHDRDVATGWAWDGINDVGGYVSEQILSTTLFRAYRSSGGGSKQVAMQRNAARTIVSLIIRAIGSLATSPITPSPEPEIYESALETSDIGTALLDSQPGGCLTKVVRWAFEQQGMFQPAGVLPPITTKGAAPAVDVFVEDGRHGEYTYHEDYWQTTDIWNRHEPDHHAKHQTPVVDETNYAYVRVHNRGAKPASGVVVRAYHARPTAGLVWPDDCRSMQTASIPVPGTIAPGGQVVVGPFRWRPLSRHHDSMFAAVTCPSDPANTEPASFAPCATGPSPMYRLVPFDNNLALRSVVPVPGAGGRRHLERAFRGRRFWAANPFDRTAKVEIRPELPAFLSSRGWAIDFNNAGASSFSLGPRDRRAILPRLISGQNFTRADLQLAGPTAIVLRVLVDGLVVGGITYVLDPDLERLPRERREEDDANATAGLSSPKNEKSTRNAAAGRMSGSASST